MKTIVIGLGNPILGDDGVGWAVVSRLRPQIESFGAEVDWMAEGGLGLMERVVGYERLIVVDSLETGQFPTGTVVTLKLDDLPNPFIGHMGSAHETNLRTALELGRNLGAQVPDQVDIVAIESPYVYDFSEALSAEIESAVPQAASCVLALLEESLPVKEGAIYGVA